MCRTSIIESSHVAAGDAPPAWPDERQEEHPGLILPVNSKNPQGFRPGSRAGTDRGQAWLA